MQHVLNRLQVEPGYLAVEEVLSVGHLYGPANAPSDAGSRGREPLMRQLLVQMGCDPRRVLTPPFVPALLAELVELNRSLTATERFLGSSRSNEYTGDGPSPWRTASYPPSRVRAGGRLPATWARGAAAPPQAPPGGRLGGVGPLRVGSRVAKPTSAGAPLQAALCLAHVAVAGPRLPLAFGVAAAGAQPEGVSMPRLGGQMRAPAPPPAAARRLPVPVRGQGAPSHAGAFVDSASASQAGSLASMLAGDTSPWAIPAHNMSLVEEIYVDVLGLALDGAPVGTKRQQRSDWKHWTAWCTHIGVDPWRFDARANQGLDPVGARREAFLLAGGLRFIYNRMIPRSRKDPVPQPQSALNVILGVRRMHKTRGYPMVAMPMVGAMVKGLMRRVQAEYGVSHPGLLVPTRKEPFTREVLDGLADVADGAVRVPGYGLLCWASVTGRSLWALLCTLCSTGFRKSEVART